MMGIGIEGNVLVSENRMVGQDEILVPDHR
jgi:hypothetical protein